MITTNYWAPTTVLHQKYKAWSHSLKKFHLFSKKPFYQQQSHSSDPFHIMSKLILNIYRANEKSHSKLDTIDKNIIVPSRASKNTRLLWKSFLMKFLHFFRKVSTNNSRSNRNLYEQNTGKTKKTPERDSMQHFWGAEIKACAAAIRPAARQLRLQAYVWTKWTEFFCWKNSAWKKSPLLDSLLHIKAFISSFNTYNLSGRGAHGCSDTWETWVLCEHCSLRL